MLKVILIDDEDVIIEGLKVLIDWGGLGFDIAGVAYDGEAAVALAEKVAPDIIVTDIRMPVLSGIEMISRVKQILPQVAIIILSGYSDFDYARQALEQGANCYLLKPVTRAELTQKISAIRDQIMQEQIRQASLSNLRDAAKEKYLKKLVDGKITAARQNHQIWDLFEFGKLPQSTCTILFEVVGLNSLEMEPVAERLARKASVDNMLEDLNAKTKAGLFFSYSDEWSVLIAYSENLEELEKAINNFVDEAKRIVAESLQITLSVGIGGVYIDMDCLAQSFNEAVESLESKLATTADIENLSPFHIQNEFKPNPLIKELVAEIEACDKEGFQRLLDRLFQDMLFTAGYTMNQVYTESLNILVLLRQMAPTQTGGLSMLFKEEIFNLYYLKKFKAPSELQQWLLGLAYEVIDSIKDQPITNREQLVDQIKKYLEQNFATVTRETVAAHFYMNPSYLSQLFKQIVGVSFIDYLTEIRVKQAKKLLIASDYKIQLIAEKVGYGSSQHFNKIFEKYVSMSPFDYRKQHGK